MNFEIKSCRSMKVNFLILLSVALSCCVHWISSNSSSTLHLPGRGWWALPRCRWKGTMHNMYIVHPYCFSLPAIPLYLKGSRDVLHACIVVETPCAGLYLGLSNKMMGDFNCKVDLSFSSQVMWLIRIIKQRNHKTLNKGHKGSKNEGSNHFLSPCALYLKLCDFSVLLSWWVTSLVMKSLDQIYSWSHQPKYKPEHSVSTIVCTLCVLSILPLYAYFLDLPSLLHPSILFLYLLHILVSPHGLDSIH